jgi:hypothetical protein
MPAMRTFAPPLNGKERRRRSARRRSLVGSASRSDARRDNLRLDCHAGIPTTWRDHARLLWRPGRHCRLDTEDSVGAHVRATAAASRDPHPRSSVWLADRDRPSALRSIAVEHREGRMAKGSSEEPLFCCLVPLECPWACGSPARQQVGMRLPRRSVRSA